MHFSRRGLLAGSAAAFALPGTSLSVRAAETDSRFILIFLRGAVDGMSVVVPYGDPNLRALRPALIPPEPGQAGGMGDLGGFWGLHPSLKAAHALYRAGDMLAVHAVAGPNRSRSHFEAQDMMECGSDRRLTSGWLNRIAAALPANPNCDNAFAVGSMLPLVLRGNVPSTTWSPFHERPTVSPHFYDNIAWMHDGDPVTGTQVSTALKSMRFVDRSTAGTNYSGLKFGFSRLARATAALLSAPDGPCLAELDLDGWDTHDLQVPRLAETLGILDDGLAILRTGMDKVWSRTVIMIVTEFGRTARMNGTDGTDHGTASVSLLLGGAIAGGRVIADWPGLRQDQMLEDRDLAPTIDVRAVAKGLVGPHFGLTAADLETAFPDSREISPMSRLIRA
jgi:uncharacterized protein (DUF1501 family)